MNEENRSRPWEKFEPMATLPIEVDSSDTVLGICLLRLYEVA